MYKKINDGDNFWSYAPYKLLKLLYVPVLVGIAFLFWSGGESVLMCIFPLGLCVMMLALFKRLEHQTKKRIKFRNNAVKYGKKYVGTITEIKVDAEPRYRENENGRIQRGGNIYNYYLCATYTDENGQEHKATSYITPIFHDMYCMHAKGKHCIIYNYDEKAIIDAIES